MKKRSTLVSTVVKDPPAGAYKPEPRVAEYRESRCHACCTSPYGCARNYVCDCHKTAQETGGAS